LICPAVLVVGVGVGEKVRIHHAYAVEKVE